MDLIHSISLLEFREYTHTNIPIHTYKYTQNTKCTGIS